MKRMVIVVVALIALGSFAPGSTKSDPSASKMAWEYKIVYLSHTGGTSVEAQVNRLGDDGWELVDVGLRDSNGSVDGSYFFKRPK